ncbi:MAG: single-stranded DNA-binding protein [Saprospiraceae bacterium]|nr:single-stranded DNA-binding protein [Saprospiraceae bacterium]
MVNKVFLIGNLGRDPEVRHLEGGNVVAKFPVATNESYRDKSGEWQKITEWHDVVVWRALAERAEKQLQKGSLVYVEGKITHRKWQDRDGNDRWSTEIVANTFRSLDRRESSDRGYAQDFPSTNALAGSPSAVSNEPSGPDTQAVEDDLPF